MLIRSRVLVLNQNYQPLNICDVRRAVSLLGKGKAETVQHGVEYIHTVSRMFERPEVIRLVYMVRKPLHRRKLSRREVFQRDGYSCQLLWEAKHAVDARPCDTALQGRSAYVGERRDGVPAVQS